MSKFKILHFWYSGTHSEHIRDMGDPRRYTVVIDGAEQEYTCCTSDAEEPFTGALKRFPDYQKLGVATLRDVRVS